MNMHTQRERAMNTCACVSVCYLMVVYVSESSSRNEPWFK